MIHGFTFLKNILANELVKKDFDGFVVEAKLSEKFDPQEIEEIRQCNDVLPAINEMIKRKFPDRIQDLDKLMPLLEEIQNMWHVQILDGLNRNPEKSRSYRIL